MLSRCRALASCPACVDMLTSAGDRQRFSQFRNVGCPSASPICFPFGAMQDLQTHTACIGLHDHGETCHGGSSRLQAVLRSRATSRSMSKKLELAASLPQQKTSATSDVSQLSSSNRNGRLSARSGKLGNLASSDDL